MRNVPAIAAIVSSVLFAPAALALTGKAFVSGSGNDTNTSNQCSKGSPCRTLAAAYGITVPGGQIVVIDTAVYQPMTITMPVTISAPPGVTAIVQVGASQIGFTVAAGASDIVVLRNLQIFSTNAGSTGINHTSGKLIVDHVELSGLTVGLASTSKLDLLFTNFYGNDTGLQMTGTGCNTTSPPVCSTTTARIHGGNFVGNGVALASVNPGDSMNNILMWNSEPSTSAWDTYFAGNGTFMTSTGTGGVGVSPSPGYFYIGHNPN